MVNRRMFIPKKLRGTVIKTLHSAHQGVSGMKALARERFWWPSMDACLTQARSQCRKCNERAMSQPSEEWLEEEAPTFLFESICMDYYDLKDKHYLTSKDRFSGWLSVHKFAEGKVCGTGSPPSSLQKEARHSTVKHSKDGGLNSDKGRRIELRQDDPSYSSV